MKIRIDAELCTGHARCNVVAPEVYSLDEDGYNLLRGQEYECPAGLEEAARLGAANCPEHSIILSE
jgi:ferredoxin